MAKIEELEAKISRAVELLESLRRENQQLRTERDSLQSHVAMLTSENNKAQRILAEHEQLRKRQEQAALRVERALKNLDAVGIS